MSADENSLQRKLEEELSSKSQLENKVKLLEETIENEKLTTSELSETLKAADQIKSNYEKVINFSHYIIFLLTSGFEAAFLIFKKISHTRWIRSFGTLKLEE